MTTRYFIQQGGTTVYYKDEFMTIFHSEDGPAILSDNGTKEWWLDGQRHRIDGPAVERPDGKNEFWLHNKLMTKHEFLTATRQVPSTPFEDPDVQMVYKILCNREDDVPTNESWEGWIARRIVDGIREKKQPDMVPPILRAISEAGYILVNTSTGCSLVKTSSPIVAQNNYFTLGGCPKCGAKTSDRCECL